MSPDKLKELRDESSVRAGMEGRGVLLTPVTLQVDCFHKGPDAGPKGWHYCDHPADPLGADLVCTCKGCGPRCPGYMRVVHTDPIEPTKITAQPVSTMKWSYAVTTVPERRGDYLPRTLHSLRLAGFDRPRLAIDGEADPMSWSKEFGLDCVGRWPRLRVHGNWVVTAHELLVLEPTADRYAIFQDDVLVCRGLREYLEHVPYPGDGYLNLYTVPSNYQVVKQGGNARGFFPSNQNGRGALALVFDREALLALLSSSHMVRRPLDPSRGWKAVDGGIVDSMRKAGRKEYCHNPSLVQHAGVRSSMGPKRLAPLADSFMGEEWDARSLLS